MKGWFDPLPGDSCKSGEKKKKMGAKSQSPAMNAHFAAKRRRLAAEKAAKQIVDG